MFILGILAFVLQGCTHDDYIAAPVDPQAADKVAYAAADMVNGYKLYNEFTKAETGAITGFVPNDPSVVAKNITDYSDFYRCKSCHGWDQKGRNGSYINRPATATRPNPTQVQLTNLRYADISILFEKIKHTGGATVDPARTANGLNTTLGGDNHPDFGKILSDAKIWDLVKFLKEGAFDTDQLYAINIVGAYPATVAPVYTDLGRDGNVTSGDTFFSTKCVSCHGTDGKKIMFGTTSLGKFVRTKPYEIQHKIVSGQLGTIMGHTPATLQDVKNLFKAMNDNVKYPN